MFDVEILYLARQLGYRIKEVGVRWQDDGDSRSNLVGGTWRHARDLFRIRFGTYSTPNRARVTTQASAPLDMDMLSDEPVPATAAAPAGGSPARGRTGRAC